jgi:A/G-specific adenine glycosylase
MKSHLEIEKLKNWFLTEKRDLPWRQNPSPYFVWISEVMLQQTQVAVVVPYFLRWIERFPTIQDLAEATLDEVIKTWEGLGYYSRARYLHEGAKFILAYFNGELPAEEDKLKKIKGLGPYTIGAILSFAFHQKKAAVDGNVLRVLTRYFQIEEDIAKPATVKRLRLLMEDCLPDEEPWIINEALIELGATICQRKARCSECPLQQTCLSFRHQLTEKLPIKAKLAKTKFLYRAVAILSCHEHYLIKRGKKGEIMSDLHEFPFFEVSMDGITTTQFQVQIEQSYGLATQVVQSLPQVYQSFTRYQVLLNPVLFSCKTPIPIEGFEWMSLPALKKLAFSSGHRRIFELVQTL